MNFIAGHNSVIFSKSGNSDGTAYNKLFAIFGSGNYLTSGFPRTNMDIYTIWLQRKAIFDENDVDVLWECDPIDMEIKTFEREDVVFGDQSVYVVNMLQDKMKENLIDGIAPEEMKWQRMEKLTLDISFSPRMDGSWAEPGLIISALKNLKYLCLRCRLFNDHEFDALSNKPIPDTWEKTEVRESIEDTDPHFIYRLKTIDQ